MNGEWMVRNIMVLASRLSPSGRALKEDELRKLSPEALRALWLTFRDAEAEISRERRSFRPFPGGPRIRG